MYKHIAIAKMEEDFKKRCLPSLQAPVEESPGLLPEYYIVDRSFSLHAPRGVMQGREQHCCLMRGK